MRAWRRERHRLWYILVSSTVVYLLAVGAVVLDPQWSISGQLWISATLTAGYLFVVGYSWW